MSKGIMAGFKGIMLGSLVGAANCVIHRIVTALPQTANKEQLGSKCQ